jgi:hypothetical protein
MNNPISATAEEASMRMFEAQAAVEAAALRSITAHHYGRVEDPHADAEDEYAGEQLALAARDLVRAVEALPENERPVGWDVEVTA